MSRRQHEVIIGPGYRNPSYDDPGAVHPDYRQTKRSAEDDK
jgi:hypothetical protein